MVLSADECPEYYKEYLQLVGENVLMQLEDQLISFTQYLDVIPKEKELYHYADDKWTIKQILGHIIDTERVLFYRALCIARHDKTSFPGFDQNNYVAATDFNARKMKDLINDFVVQRRVTVSLYKSLRDEELKRIGTASGRPVSARALFYFILGHLEHHKMVLQESYLSK